MTIARLPLWGGLWLTVVLLITGCTALSPRPATAPPPSQMGSIMLAWDDPDNANQNVGGYYLYYWQADWEEPKRVDVGLQTTYTLSGLEVGQMYSFAVTVHDGHGRRESTYSNVVSQRVSPEGTASEINPHRGGRGVSQRP